jgi:hypothetical protein
MFSFHLSNSFYHLLSFIGLSILIIKNIHSTFLELKRKEFGKYEISHLYMQLVGSIRVGIFSFHFKIWALFVLNIVGIIQSIIYLYHIYQLKYQIS